MKRMMLLLFVAALLVPAIASAQEIGKGDTAIMPHEKVVILKNLEKISMDSVAPDRYGAKCITERGSVVTVVGIDEDRLLVRYFVAINKDTAHCQSGSLFFLGILEFSTMKAEFRRIQEVEQKERAFIEKALRDYRN